MRTRSKGGKVPGKSPYPFACSCCAKGRLESLCVVCRFSLRIRKYGRKNLYLDHTLVPLDYTSHLLGCDILFYEVSLVCCAICMVSYRLAKHLDRAQWSGEIFTGFGSHTDYTRK